MSGLFQLTELSKTLKDCAAKARILAHEDRANAAEIHWAAHQIEDIAEELDLLSTDAVAQSTLRVLSH